MWFAPEINRSPKGIAESAGACLIALILLASLPVNTGSAAIFACKDNNGTVVFQDRPCPVNPPVHSAATPKRQFPLGINESWFDQPDYVNDRPYCDRRSCECGQIERRHRGNLAHAVANALYLDGSWQRYEMAYQAWYDLPTPTAERYLKHSEMMQASCEIMISQKLLRDFAGNVVQDLDRQVKQVEAFEANSAETCQNNPHPACSLHESVRLYEQILTAAAALKTPRQAMTAAAGNANR
jgi:hypothetical protein